MVIDGVPVSVVCIAESLTDTGRFFMRFSRLFRGILLALTGAVASYTGCAIAENKPSPDNINFDVDALRSLGYGAEIADFFKAGSQFFPGDHDVVIKVNGTGSYSELVTIGDRGQLCVTPELIRKLKLKAAPFDATCKQLSDIIPEAKVTPFPDRYEIEILVPEDAFDSELRGQDLTTGGFALMSNYRVYGMRTENQNSQQFYQGQFESGMNIKNWVLRNNSSFTSGKDSTSYQFNETTLSRGIESFKSILELGQINSQGAMFGGTPLNGLQLFSDPALQDEGRLLVPITGIAETASTVEVKQNGRLLYRTLVPAGPFQLDRVNGMVIGQPLDVSVIQDDGLRSRFQVNTSPIDLNQSGPMNYQLALGKYRQRNSSDDSETPLIASLEGDRSFNQSQLSAGGLFAGAFQSVGSRIGQNWVGNYPGSASLGIIAARSNSEQGLQVDSSLGLALGAVSLGLSTLARSQKYPTLETALQREAPTPIDEDNEWAPSQADALKTSTSVSLGWSDAKWGRFGYSLGLNQFYQDKADTLLHTLSYGRKFGDVSMSLSFQTASDRDNRFYLSASVPLGKRSTLSSQMQRYQGEDNYTTSFSHNPDELWGYSVGAGHRGDHNRLNGMVRATTAYSNLSANGSWGDDHSRSMMFTASGAAAFAGGTFATSPYALSDTFGIVKVPGQAGVRVKAMGSGTTVTNHFGTAAIASLPTNKKTTVQLDTKALPLNVRLDSTSFDIAVSRGTVISKEIKATVLKQLLLTIRTLNGELAPAGASVLDKDGALAGVVIGSGNVMLSNEQIDKQLLVRVPNQNDCRLSFTPPAYFDPNALYEEADAVCN